MSTIQVHRSEVTSFHDVKEQKVPFGILNEWIKTWREQEQRAIGE